MLPFPCKSVVHLRSKVIQIPNAYVIFWHPGGSTFPHIFTAPTPNHPLVRIRSCKIDILQSQFVVRQDLKHPEPTGLAGNNWWPSTWKLKVIFAGWIGLTVWESLCCAKFQNESSASSSYAELLQDKVYQLLTCQMPIGRVRPNFKTIAIFSLLTRALFYLNSLKNCIEKYILAL